MLKITTPLVSADWLNENIDNPNLIIIDATMKKITWENSEFENQDIQIKNARYLDIKNVFSDTSSELPNMMLSKKKFQKQARKLGVNNNSIIVVYDDIGIYTSPRVWWMFQSMAHFNIAVLDGGLPEWIKKGFPVEKKIKYDGDLGNFEAVFNSNAFVDSYDVLSAIDDSDTVILDARSPDRFNGTKLEPRKGLRSGHIPNSKSLHYTDLLNNNLMKSNEELKIIFKNKAIKKDEIIFSCGSGITACILALGAEISGYTDLSIYDGSWTEWGSLEEFPIEK